MSKEEIYTLMNENPVFFLATTEGDQPHVRGMLLYKADEEGIIFHTAATKDLYKQVSANAKVELCFNGKGTQVRVSGILEEVKDKKLEEEIYEHPSRQFLRNWKEKGIDAGLVIYKLKHGKAVTWTMAQNFSAKEPIQL